MELAVAWLMQGAVGHPFGLLRNERVPAVARLVVDKLLLLHEDLRVRHGPRLGLVLVKLLDLLVGRDRLALRGLLLERARLE